MSLPDLPPHCLELIQLFYAKSVKDVCTFSHISTVIRDKTREIRRNLTLKLEEPVTDEFSPLEEAEGTKQELLEKWRAFVATHTNPEVVVKRGINRMHLDRTSLYAIKLRMLFALIAIPVSTTVAAMYFIPRETTTITIAVLAYLTMLIIQWITLRKYFRGFPVFTGVQRRNGMRGGYQNELVTPYMFIASADAFCLLLVAACLYAGHMSRRVGRT